jgi:hypothetical protein
MRWSKHASRHKRKTKCKHTPPRRVSCEGKRGGHAQVRMAVRMTLPVAPLWLVSVVAPKLQKVKVKSWFEEAQMTEMVYPSPAALWAKVPWATSASVKVGVVYVPTKAVRLTVTDSHVAVTTSLQAEKMLPVKGTVTRTRPRRADPCRPMVMVPSLVETVSSPS